MAQQLQNITIAAPGFAGLNTQDSPIGVDPSFAAIADNCVIDKLGRIGARKGWEEVTTNGSSVLGSSRGIETVFEFVDKSGDKRVISAGNNKIFLGTTTLTDITPSSYTITANNWKCVTFNDHLYMVQSGHAPLLATDHGGSFVLEPVASHSHATGTMPSANEALAAFGRLWVADVVGNKHTVYWSDLLQGHHWTGGTSGSLDIEKVWPSGYDEIVSLTAHNDFLIIFGKRSIVVYSGATSPANMVLADTIEGGGCIARDSVQQTGTDVIFLSDSGLRSFGRVIQEKSLPMRDISKYVRNDLMEKVNVEQLPIKSLYSPDEAFYLLSLPSTNTVYCFDMRGPLDQSGAHRATTWTGLDPLSFARLEDDTIYIGKSTGIVKYAGYLDGTATYQLRYFSNPTDFGNSSNLKFLKKFNLTIVGAHGTDITLNWGYDYTDVYNKQAFTFSASNAIAEYGVAEYAIAEYSGGADALINTPSVNTGGSGSIVTIGIEAQIDNVPFSIQKIDIHALLGRLI
jgi:hypothetical protein